MKQANSAILTKGCILTSTLKLIEEAKRSMRTGSSMQANRVPCNTAVRLMALRRKFTLSCRCPLLLLMDIVSEGGEGVGVSSMLCRVASLEVPAGACLEVSMEGRMILTRGIALVCCAVIG